MRKTRILFASLLTTSLVPVFVTSACAKKEEEEVIPESITLTYGDGLTDDITIDENGTLEFKTQVFPENAKQDVVIESSNLSAAIIEGNKLIPKGFGTTKISAYPVGYPGLRDDINVTINVTEDLTKIDENNVQTDNLLVMGMQNEYTITLSNFWADFLVDKNQHSYLPTHSLTAKLLMLNNDVELEDYSAGIPPSSIHHDSFNNSTFDVACSFKYKEMLPSGYQVKFKLKFDVDYGEITHHEIYGTREYSATFLGETLSINDEGTSKTVTFDKETSKATIPGFVSNFDFGEGTKYNLTVDFYSTLILSDASITITDKFYDSGQTHFSIVISLFTKVEVFQSNETIAFHFSVNNAPIFNTGDYSVTKIDQIRQNAEPGLNMFTVADGKSTITFNDFESNFDFDNSYSNVSLAVSSNFGSEGGLPASDQFIITKKANNFFDLELIWNSQLPAFTNKTLWVKFFKVGTASPVSELNFFVSNNPDAKTITYLGVNQLKLANKKNGNLNYCVQLTKFACNFMPERDEYGPVGFVATFNSQSQIESPQIFFTPAEYGSGSYKNFAVQLWWKTSPIVDDPINCSLSIAVEGETLVNQLQFSISKPSDDNYYTFTVDAAGATVNVIKNSKTDGIEVGLSNIDSKNELIGLIVNINFLEEPNINQWYSYASTGPNQMSIYIHPEYLLQGEYGREIDPSTLLTVKPIFKNESTQIINITSPTTITSQLFNDAPFYQTDSGVNIVANQTYLITANLANWPFVIQQSENIEGFYFICADDLADYNTYQPFNDPIVGLYNGTGLQFYNQTDLGAYMVEIEHTGVEWAGLLPQATISIIWTPNFSRNNVKFALMGYASIQPDK